MLGVFAGLVRHWSEGSVLTSPQGEGPRAGPMRVPRTSRQRDEREMRLAAQVLRHGPMGQPTTQRWVGDRSHSTHS
jgi:hypothetical protein